MKRAELRQKAKERYQETKAEIAEYARDYYKRNREVVIERVTKYRKANAHKRREYIKTYTVEYRQRPGVKESYRAHCAKRWAKKKQRTPLWADLDAIHEFYKNCPEGYEVDHIVPLQGELVSGLHVLNNLQYLTPRENTSKNNHFEPEFIVNSQRPEHIQSLSTIVSSCIEPSS